MSFLGVNIVIDVFSLKGCHIQSQFHILIFENFLEKPTFRCQKLIEIYEINCNLGPFLVFFRPQKIVRLAFGSWGNTQTLGCLHTRGLSANPQNVATGSMSGQKLDFEPPILPREIRAPKKITKDNYGDQNRDHGCETTEKYYRTQYCSVIELTTNNG